MIDPRKHVKDDNVENFYQKSLILGFRGYYASNFTIFEKKTVQSDWYCKLLTHKFLEMSPVNAPIKILTLQTLEHP